jgi:uncharacterized protein (DUF362 family)
MKSKMRGPTYSDGADAGTRQRAVWIERMEALRPAAVRRAIDKVGRLAQIGPGTRVFVKPNLTFPFYREGVTTRPEMIRATAQVLAEQGAEVTVGEAGPSLDVFSTEASFVAHGLPSLTKDLGVRVVDLCKLPSVPMRLGRGSAARNVPVPRILLEETDVFVSLPVVKVHAMTQVSLSMKNQWGCIPTKKRFLLHPSFKEIVVAVNGMLPNPLILCDGRWVLTDNGPMFGTPRRGEFLAAANDFGAFDVAMCRLMDVPVRTVAHIRHAQREGLAPRTLEEIALNCDPAEFRPCRFRLRRTIQNYIALAGFHSALVCKLGYDSMLSGALHKVLYAVKGNPLEEAMAEEPPPDRRAA